MKDCKECWDPVDHQEKDLCDWCSMTEKERKASMRQSMLLIVLITIATLVAIYYDVIERSVQ